jgi:hypothetical protein
MRTLSNVNTVGTHEPDNYTKAPHKLALIVASAVLAGVGLAASARADPTIYPPSYGSNGVFAVGTQTGDGLTAFIPPGRYRVDQAPGFFSAPGFWQRCNGLPCAPTYPDHNIGTGFASRQDSTLMDILPSDTAVYLYEVTLTSAG